MLKTIKTFFFLSISFRSTHQRLAHDVITIPYASDMFRLRVHSKGRSIINQRFNETVCLNYMFQFVAGFGTKTHGKQKTIPAKKHSDSLQFFSSYL